MICRGMGAVKFAFTKSFFLALLVGLWCSAAIADDRSSLDVLIHSGTIVDGSDGNTALGDVGVRNGKISSIGDLQGCDAQEVIDATGMIVAPGLVDVSSVPVGPLLERRDVPDRLVRLGITTIHMAPLLLDAASTTRLGWERTGDFLQTLDLKGLPVNVVFSVPFSHLRRSVLGAAVTASGPADLDRLQAETRDAMLAGAIGVSLVFSLESRAKLNVEEISAVAATVHHHAGRLFIWLSEDRDSLLREVDLALAASARSGCPVHFHNLEANGHSGAEFLDRIAERLNDAVVGGQDVTADMRWTPSSLASRLKLLPASCVSFGSGVQPLPWDDSVRRPSASLTNADLAAIFRRHASPDALIQAFARASQNGANHLLARRRGGIAVGVAADLLVLKPLEDKAEVKRNGGKPPAGIRHVLVNGSVVLRNGEPTRKVPGRVLRGPGSADAALPHAMVTGWGADRFQPVDACVQALLKKHRAPGAAVAISEHGKLVYSRGFGYADVGRRQVVTPMSRFRIASLAKPISAVALMQLVEQGKIDLDQPLLSVLGDCDPLLRDGSSLDKRLQQVTTREVLQHRGGWDRSLSSDPMFQSLRIAKALGMPPPAGQAEIISFVLGRPLDFDPGERYAYSNFGYCLLGRAIEAVTGITYEDYVKQHVLAPLGIESMVVGASRLGQRCEGEVRYYDPWLSRSVFQEDLCQRVASPYGAWPIETMDSHGGWIATAEDLVRFADALNQPDACPLLSEESVLAMRHRPPGLAGYSSDGEPLRRYYALGWDMRCDEKGKWRVQTHAGSLPGTSTQLVHRSDGLNLAILLNTRTTSMSDGLLSWEVLESIERELESVAAEPSQD